ncbi:hypothetical protein PENTCL1PPCAC_21115 [Pristionchus entomophagus]|uniref:Uncharacterized protein n=1 Tax=Pristionchus entomophagus TaxID=358040 RepID=A0AAV5TXF8_9BILA|nr:hypothetical protein PENTCL1PPCAC_21115 [Pristionchus entomophagus]
MPLRTRQISTHEIRYSPRSVSLAANSTTMLLSPTSRTGLSRSSLIVEERLLFKSIAKGRLNRTILRKFQL